jgi:F-type H+-transporting ATPase subunit delta
VIRDRAIARRYAVALFGAARKAGATEEILADLGAVNELETSNPSLRRFLEAPDVLTEHKTAVLSAIFHGRVHELVERLFDLMLRKKRIQHFPFVHEEYRALVEEELGIARARVTTAVPLDPALAGELVKRLEKLTHKQVRLDARVDPAILGGVVTVVGGKILDGSLRHWLADLREQLLAVRVH